MIHVGPYPRIIITIFVSLAPALAIATNVVVVSVNELRFTPHLALS